ncbi:MAG: GDSL-type esterase/lipase family protein [Candidatus Spechtbacterales bacterium]
MNLNKIIIYIAVVLLIVGVVYFFTRENRDVKQPVAGKNIVAFGDSLVYGAGATEGNNWVDVLSRDISEEITNAGVNGDTTESALARLDSDVLDKNPRIVIILLGGNDVLRRIPKEETLNNLEQIITRIQAEGAVVVLVGIPGKLLDPYDDEYEELAKETRSAFVPNILKNILKNRDLMHDSIHPNDAGNKIMAERIGKVLTKVVQ